MALQRKYRQREGKNIYIFILDDYIHKYKISFLAGMATLHVLHMFIFTKHTLSNVIKGFLETADNSESQRSNNAQSKEPMRSDVQQKINNSVGSQWAF